MIFDICSQDALELITPVSGTKVMLTKKGVASALSKHPDAHSYRLQERVDSIRGSSWMLRLLQASLSMQKTQQYEKCLAGWKRLTNAT